MAPTRPNKRESAKPPIVYGDEDAMKSTRVSGAKAVTKSPTDNVSAAKVAIESATGEVSYDTMATISTP